MEIRRIYLDANIFIKLFESDDEIAHLLGQLVERAGRRSVAPLATSELTLAEVLVAPTSDGDTELTANYEASLVSNAAWSVAPIARTTLRQAASLRAAHKALKLPDAIHLASAAEIGSSHFLTGDLGLLRVMATARFRESSTLIGLPPILK